jgi:hypothetical protein
MALLESPHTRLDLALRDAPLFRPMASNWATPQYTREEVDAAGDVLAHMGKASGYEIESAFYTINNWRSSHSFPLNTFQVGLREKAKQVDSNRIVAQRIKRLSSIHQKLLRFPKLKLSEIQDIGGCRAVVKSVREIDQVVKLYQQSQIKHKLDHIDDYIRTPKRSGYRGVHLIYRYYSDKKKTYNGLKIEIQLRSPLQHAWATAVETVGTFTRQALKSSKGEKQWLRFFALMGSAIANRERTASVPNTPPERADLVAELRHYVSSLDIIKRLETYGEALQTLEGPSVQGAHYFLLALDPGAQQVTITGFVSRELEKAADAYLATERSMSEQTGAEAVLVSVESLASLRRAYPNYFLDTRVFIETVKRAIA